MNIDTKKCLNFLNNIMEFIYTSIKICTRDLYLLPRHNIINILYISLTLLIASLLSKTLFSFQLLDTRGTLLGIFFIVLITVVDRFHK